MYYEVRVVLLLFRGMQVDKSFECTYKIILSQWIRLM